jgi:hypothetical protein
MLTSTSKFNYLFLKCNIIFFKNWFIMIDNFINFKKCIFITKLSSKTSILCNRTWDWTEKRGQL